MRPAQQQRPRIRRRWIVIGAIVFLLFISVSSIVRFYTDLLWFDEVDLASVFWTIFYTRIGVGVVAGLFAGLIVLVNLEVARRVAPQYRFVSGGSDLAEQYRSVFRPYARWANLGAAAVVAFFTGLSASAAWDTYLLWRNARPFGQTAPEPFGRDVSFYVFSIPFQRAVLGLLFGVLIVSILFAAAGHLLNGSIQPEQNRINIATAVKVHLSVLLGLIALLKAWAYRLDTFELVYSARGTVTGASYTDVNAQRPALRFLMIIAVVVALIFFANVVRFRSWLLPGAAIGLWVFSSVLLGAIIPAAVQRFQVTPNESEREEEFIARNIEATREAFDLDRIELEQFPAEERLTEEDVEDNRGTIDNIRLWAPTVLEPTFQRLQAIRTYYAFEDVDIDRYMLDGNLTQVMLSAREMDPSQLSPSAQNWVNNRLVYTHGYGMVAVQAKSVTPEGLPSFVASDLPPRTPDEMQIEQGGIYYGEGTTGYSIVNTGQNEIDYPRGEGGAEVVTTNYPGQGGVELSSFLRRLAFAVRFSDTDLLISGFIQPDSRVMMRRNILERASTAAPFLSFDGDPYLVVSDGRLYWMMDAYTTTDRYPYSQIANLNQITVSGNFPGQGNYMRNSVKVVVDAFEGTMDYYLVDPSDAIATTYQAVFPDLFTPGDEMPEDLQAHMRYPEDLFKAQAAMYRDYHILDPRRLYEREDVWDIPNDPVRSTSQARVAMDPYYVVMKLPGEEQEEFLLMMPFTPRDRPILNGWVAARMDPGHYGELVGFSFPRGASIEGPENISARIEQNEVIARQFTLWEGAGSDVQRGNLFVIPIGESLIYVQPIYLQAAEAARALPELRRVIVVVGDSIGFEPTLEASLTAAITGAEPVVVEDDEEPPPPEERVEPTEPTGNVAQLLQQAIEHFVAADQALRDGDLATYQRENEAGQAAVEEAQQQASS